MQKSFFYNDQYPTADDFNNIESTKASQSILRSQAPLGNSGGIGKNYSFWTGSTSRGGIFGDPSQSYGSGNIDFRCTSLVPSIIIVYYGTAMDRNGEIIQIPAAQASKYCSRGASDANYVWTTAANVQNYVKLSHLQVSGSMQSDDNGVQFPTRYTDSYYITIDGTVPTADQLLLATFSADSSGNVIAIQDRRSFVRTITPADAVIVDPSYPHLTFEPTLSAHVRATGSGTPSLTNPHGLAVSDLGGYSVAEHGYNQHSNGIYLSVRNAASYGSWAPSLINASTLTFAAPVNAVMLIAGAPYTPEGLSVHISDAPAAGNYWIMYDQTTAAAVYVAEATALTWLADDSRPDNYIALAMVNVYDAGGGTLLFNLSAPYPVDKRQFFNITQTEIRADVTETAASTAITVADNLQVNLNRIRYYLGMALNGTTVWNGANPLTSGYVSDGSAYHTHTHTAFTQFTIGKYNTSTPGDRGISIMKSATKIAGIYYNYNPADLTVKTWKIISDYDSSGPSMEYATLEVGDINIYSNTGYMKAVTYQKAADLVDTLTGGTSTNADTLHTHNVIASTLTSFVLGAGAGEREVNHATAYQNTALHAISVAVLVTGTTATDCYADVYAGTGSAAVVSRDAALVIYGHQLSKGSLDNERFTVTFLVPSGYYYLVDATGVIATSWWETA